MTGNAKKDRKKTACPGGTSTEAAFTRLAIPMNIQTDKILNAMPRSGCMTAPFGGHIKTQAHHSEAIFACLMAPLGYPQSTPPKK
jgi:hypothetical protein